jgi:polygalacturonase
MVVALQACGDSSKDNWKGAETVLKNIVEPKFPDKKFDIRDFGATEGGVVTEAIAKAINKCNNDGGGIVVVPAGEWYTGAITLKSNVNLHISEGAVLKFSVNPKDYTPFVLTRWEGIDCINFQPLIYAYEQENIAVTGKGVLDGQASENNWWAWKGAAKYGWVTGKLSQHYRPDAIGGREKLGKMNEHKIPVEQRVMEEDDCLRPPFIQPYKCKNVLIQDVKIIRAPFWLIHPLLCESVTVRGVTMESHGPNNDGCDPESCNNVLIEKCYFNTGDDCIAIKSGRDNDGRAWDVASENIIIRDNVMKDGHGGVVIGSEISGNCRNVWAENCEMDSPNLDRVVRIKSNAVRGGVIENVFVRNIKVGECKEAVFRVEMKYEKVMEGTYLPVVKNIFLENIDCKKSNYGIFIDGFTDYNQVSDVYVKNCNFEGVQKKELNRIIGAENVVFKNLTINGKKIESPK